ncbi:CRISPR-associated endonuclease Cas1 [Paenibacillus hexagrammi]|uniref:CRISPR-associated endonuclease Cas1 n=1 Tax=Paenibacillus hexagrammi TaxID=2908839 RepID=A0ABY3SKB0_9BACL|nr:CRISPR-associated endonuclease Cas1 [Paenibacillus sp. YPD9-1]UJF34484.1 CRISPR-associated endonuclease Cas1 [Paenibacillus sp. YPD9-1]
MSCSILATLSQISIGTVITVHSGTTPNHTGRYVGIQNGNVVIVSNGGTVYYYPIGHISVIHIP